MAYPESVNAKLPFRVVFCSRPSSVSTWLKVFLNVLAITATFSANSAMSVFLQILSTGRYSEWIVRAGALWSVAFGPFVHFYACDLIRPRVDGDQQVKKASSTFASIDQVSEFYIDSIASNQIRQAFGHTKTGL